MRLAAGTRSNLVVVHGLWRDGDVERLLHLLDEGNGLHHCGLLHHQLAHPGGQPVSHTHAAVTRLQGQGGGVGEEGVMGEKERKGGADI